MRRLSVIVCLLTVVLQLAAQMPPDWCNAASRKLHYPPELWYTGYVEGEPQNGETQEAAVARLKDAARVELVSTIRTTVEQTLDSRTVSDLQQSTSDFEERVRETFVSETRISSSIRDIPGLQIDAFRNPSTGTICAFACVKRQTLINQLLRRIAFLSGKAENNLQQALSLSAEGQKSQACRYAKDGLQQLELTEEAQNLLAAVDETADAESLQTEQTLALRRQLTSLYEQLRNATAIYLHCDAKLFDGTYTALQGAIEGAFSEQGISFVSDPAEADWAIYIDASAQEHAKTDFGSMSNYAALVEVHLSINRQSDGKRIYSNGLTSDVSNHTRGFQPAAQEAYKAVTPKIIEMLKQQIKLY